MGNMFSNKRLKIDESKIKAIIKMKKPDNVKSLESFLEMKT